MKRSQISDHRFQIQIEILNRRNSETEIVKTDLKSNPEHSEISDLKSEI